MFLRKGSAHEGQTEDANGQFAADMTTVAEQSAAMEAPWATTQANIDKSRMGVDLIATMLGDLTKTTQDIPIRLVLDQHHFNIQLSNALNFFNVNIPGAR